MEKLIAFGCSLTEGAALSDNWVKDNNNKFYTNGPSKFAWPSILAKLLNKKLDNQGRCGLTNKLIWLTALEYADYRENDIVIFLWSHMPRYTIVKKYSDFYNTNINYTLRAGDLNHKTYKSKEEKDRLQAYFNYIYDEHDMQLELFGKINHINLHLKQKFSSIKIYHLLQWDFNFVNLNWNSANIIPGIYMGEYKNQFPLGLDNLHPGEQTHTQYAKDVYNWIKKEHM